MYKVRMLTSNCTTRSDPRLDADYEQRRGAVLLGRPTQLWRHPNRTGLQSLSAYQHGAYHSRISPPLSSTWGAYSRGISIHRDNSCCSTLKVPWIRHMSRSSSRHLNPQQTLALLKRLADDLRNEVWLLSRSPIDKIAVAVPGVGIIAKNGCFIKTRKITEDASGVDRHGGDVEGPCIQILNYVRPPILPILFAADRPRFSSPNGRRAHLFLDPKGPGLTRPVQSRVLPLMPPWSRWIERDNLTMMASTRAGLRKTGMTYLIRVIYGVFP